MFILSALISFWYSALTFVWCKCCAICCEHTGFGLSANCCLSCSASNMHQIFVPFFSFQHRMNSKLFLIKWRTSLGMPKNLLGRWHSWTQKLNHQRKILKKIRKKNPRKNPRESDELNLSKIYAYHYAFHRYVFLSSRITKYKFW